MKDPRGQLARWVLHLSEMEFDIVHRRGALHNDADALSRYTHKTADPEQRYRWVCVPVADGQLSDATPLQSAATAQAGRDSPSPVREVPVSVSTAAAVTTAGTGASVTPVTIPEFHREQGQDEGIQEILSWKRRIQKPRTGQLHSPHAVQLLREWKGLVVKGPLLYRRVQPFRDAPSCLQIVVPQQLRHDLMESQHSGLGGWTPESCEARKRAPSPVLLARHAS